MKYLQIPLVCLLALMMISSASVPTRVAAASVSQDPASPTGQPSQTSALERGYRTGYSDGYSAGSRDLADQVARDYRNNEDYQRADRAYNEAWGTAEDYRDGYQQGFESGYSAGYDRQTFESSIPAGLTRRPNGPAGVSQPAPPYSEQNTNQTSSPSGSNSSQNGSNSSPNGSNSDSGSQPRSSPRGPMFLPRDTILLVELQSSLSSDASQRGDRFEARVIEPREIEGAIVDGQVLIVKRPGKVKGTAQMQLSFEMIRTPDGRTAALKADVVELINSDGAATVDSEGGVKGKDSTKDDVTKVGAGAGIGAIIGAIFGGAKGAAIGAVIGGGAGAGSVLTKRGQDVRLDRGQQMRIRTSTEVRIP